MAESQNAALINDFLGSSHIFALAVGTVIEERLWNEAAGNQLTVTQMQLLKLVSYPGCSHTIGDVATFLGVSNAAASKAVDKLVRLMLVRRREGESDRRAIHLSLTGPGRRMLEAYTAAAQKKLAEVFSQFGVDELQPVVELLDRLSASLMNGRQSVSQEICVQCGIYFRERCLLRNQSRRRCLYQRGKLRASGAAENETGELSD
jgi:DNA-binding MarR family transcriptional regulator